VAHLSQCKCCIDDCCFATCCVQDFFNFFAHPILVDLDWIVPAS
jgi:hypothetical protein